MSLPMATIVFYTLSASLAGLAVSHTSERFGRFSFSKRSLLDVLAIYLFFASFVWYGRMVRDYFAAFGVFAVLFKQNSALLQTQQILPPFAFTFAQAVFSGIFAQTRPQWFNTKLMTLTLAVHVLALVSICASNLDLSTWKWLRLVYTAILLLATIYAAQTAQTFGNRLASSLLSLRGVNHSRMVRLRSSVIKYRNAAVFGIIYHLVSIITIAAATEKLDESSQEYIYLMQNSLPFANLVCRDLYMWFAGWTVFLLLQVKLQGIHEREQTSARSTPSPSRKTAKSRDQISMKHTISKSSKTSVHVLQESNLSGIESLKLELPPDESSISKKTTSPKASADELRDIPTTKISNTGALSDSGNLQVDGDELIYPHTTGIAAIKIHLSRPAQTWMSYPDTVSNVVHRGNLYTLTVILIIATWLGYNDKNFRGDLFDPIVIANLCWLFFSPPVFSPLYWMTEWIVIPFGLLPYHWVLCQIRKHWPDTPGLDIFVSASVFDAPFKRDELGIRLTFLLIILWGSPFWAMNSLKIHAGPGTACFAFTGIGISGIGISLLDTCLGCRISILLNRLGLVPNEQVACARQVYEIVD